MFISKLIHTVELYDKYGIHRLNGVKVVYIFLVLSFFNGLFSVPNPYFYYFYLPITALTAEVTMTTLKDKYTSFIYTILGSSIMIVIFAIARPYPFFFFISIYACTIICYLIALRKLHMMLPFVPVILSLAAYSLLYPSLNQNLHMTVYNIITLLVSTAIILSCLRLFPLSYYYRLWMRSLLLSCQEIEAGLLALNDGMVSKGLSPDTIKYMYNFSKLLPKKMPTFTILKINLLIHRLYLKSYFMPSTFMVVDANERHAFIQNLRLLMLAIEEESSCSLIFTKDPTFNKLIHAWNGLCLRT